MTFNNPKKFLKLDGGNEDAEALKNLFENLQFTVEVCPDLNAHYMREKVEEYSQKPHKGVFILIILSHGGEGDVVYGTDTGEVKVHELQEYFHTTRCHRSLFGVPKVFLIDACRGGNHEKVHMHGHTQVRGLPTTSHRNVMGITDSADFMTVFASTRGNVAFMLNDGNKKGSNFTQTLVEVIKEADEDKEFNEIITEVRYRIQGKYSIQPTINTEEEADEAEAEKEEENIKEAEGQTVQASSTLLRLYYIKRFVFFD